MPKVMVLDQGGNQVEEMELSQEVFAVEQKPHLVHSAVVAQLEAKRQGTVSTKVRSEVQGGGRKPWRQKGTGRARHGSIRSPIWVGGGTTFGPKPKEYKNSMPKKMKKQALRSVLSYKVEEGKFLILDSLKLETPKTKDIVRILRDLNIDEAKTLFLTGERNDEVYKSARNIPGVKTLMMSGLNIFDLVHHDYIVATRDAVDRLEEVLMP